MKIRIEVWNECYQCSMKTRSLSVQICVKLVKRCKDLQTKVLIKKGAQIHIVCSLKVDTHFRIDTLMHD